jgi:hypothetical protein
MFKIRTRLIISDVHAKNHTYEIVHSTSQLLPTPNESHITNYVLPVVAKVHHNISHDGSSPSLDDLKAEAEPRDVDDLCTLVFTPNMTVPTTGIQLQPQPSIGDRLAVVPENNAQDNSNNDHRRDDVEETSGPNEAMNGPNVVTGVNNNNNNSNTNIGPLARTGRHQQTSSTSWYNQSLVITFATQPQLSWQPYVPVRPKELQGIPSEMWMEFFAKVHTAARTTNAHPGTCSSSLLAFILLGGGVVALFVLFLTGIVFWPMLCLLLLPVYLREYDFDQQRTPRIQAVCRQYSPAFEERTNYYVEFKSYRSGVQFCQKKIRQLNLNEEIQKQQYLKDVVIYRNDENDTATSAHYTTIV